MGILNDLLGDGFTEPDQYFMEAKERADEQRSRYEEDREKAYREFIENKSRQEQLDRIEEMLNKLLNEKV